MHVGEVSFWAEIYYDDDFRDMSNGGTAVGEKRTQLGLFRAAIVRKKSTADECVKKRGYPLPAAINSMASPPPPAIIIISVAATARAAARRAEEAGKKKKGKKVSKEKKRNNPEDDGESSSQQAEGRMKR